MNPCLTAIGLVLMMNLAAADDDSIISPKDAPLPSGPLIGAAPAHSEWTIQYTYGPPSAGQSVVPPPKEARPRLTTITKTDHFYHEITLDTENKKLERWTDGEIEVILAPGQTTPTIESLTAFDHMIVDYNKNELPGLEWVSPKNYIGMTKKNFENCLVFRQAEGLSTLTAYIDLSTRLPQQLKIGSTTLDYKFVDITLASQNFSDVVQRILEREAKIGKKLGGYGDRP